MLVSSRVLLGLKQRIKVPERALDEVISWHFCESVNIIKMEIHQKAVK